MSRLTTWPANYFRRSEFACPCDDCGNDPPVDAELLAVLEDARFFFGRPIKVTSGYRCPHHNRRVSKSATGSMHMYGRAADIQIQGIKPKMVANYLDRQYPMRFGIGTYETHVHIDTRETRARWAG